MLLGTILLDPPTVMAGARTIGRLAEAGFAWVMGCRIAPGIRDLGRA
jgi:hypothetical protein